MTIVRAARCVGMSLLLVMCLAGAALAEMVEVAPGIRVTKKTFAAPANEQPFYGFIKFDARQQAANENFLKEGEALGKNRQKFFEAAINRGWSSFTSGNIAEASRRFNQAYLIDPTQSAVYHMFAIVSVARFNDGDYAEELFKIAKQQPNPIPTLNADYGRLLMVRQRPADAQPLLEQAVIDTPDFDSAWSNLGLARFLNGDSKGACAAAQKAKQLPALAKNVQSDLAMLTTRAKCDQAQ